MQGINVQNAHLIEVYCPLVIVQKVISLTPVTIAKVITLQKNILFQSVCPIVQAVMNNFPAFSACMITY